jgi:hypothetical protein
VEPALAAIRAAARSGAAVAPGASLELDLGFDSMERVELLARLEHAFHVKVLGPDGKEVRPLQQNILAPKGQTVWHVPFAVSDPAGEYTLVARGW